MIERVPAHVIHLDDVEAHRREAGFIGAVWRDLGRAAGTRAIGVRLIELAAGEISTPPHVHHEEEEIFFVLDGSGLSWQDGSTFVVRAGDTIVHRVHAEAHTLRAGDDGMRVLAFGQRGSGGGATLPRTRVKWAWPYWLEVGRGDGPWEREAALGAPDFPEPEPERPETIRALADAALAHGRVRRLTDGLSERTGLNHVTLAPGETGAPRHCHTAEEELFVVLDGAATLYLGDEEVPVRAGHVISRPPGTGVAHGFRAGDGGLTYLAYGEKRTEDICFYPTSGRLAIRGIGLLGRIEPLPYPAEPDLF